MVQQHTFHAGTRGVTLSGGVLEVRENWNQSVLRPGVWASRSATSEVELIDLWHLETREQGLLADIHTGEVRPLIVSAQIVYPKDQSEQTLPREIVAEMRAVHLGNEQARMHFPIHGIIGTSKIEWRRKVIRTDDLLRRREWERSLLKPENLAAFTDIYSPILKSGLGWERLDFGPILARLKKRQAAYRKAGQTEDGVRAQKTIERATADLLALRGMYTAIREGDMPRADVLWKFVSETIPAAWLKREYAPGANFDDLQTRAIELATAKPKAGEAS